MRYEVKKGFGFNLFVPALETETWEEVHKGWFTDHIRSRRLKPRKLFYNYKFIFYLSTYLICTILVLLISIIIMADLFPNREIFPSIVIFSFFSRITIL